MLLATFARGVAIGLAIAAPIGPMAVLCVRRTLGRGWRLGIATGLGIATADAAFAAIATFAVRDAARSAVAFARPLHVAVGCLLAYLAFRTIGASRAAPRAAPAREGSAYASALALTLANPATIASFAALVVASNASASSPAAAMLTVAGVFAGSLSWWLALTGVVSRVRATPGGRAMRAIDLIAAVVFAAFAVVEFRRALAGAR